MNATKTLRRTAAVLVVPALMAAAACGSDSGSDEGGSKPVGKVSGAFGKDPKVTVPKDAKAPEKTVSQTVSTGKGEKVEDGAFARLDYSMVTLKDGRSLVSSFKPQPGADPKAPRTQIVQEIGGEGQIPAPVSKQLLGKKVGSRVEVEGPAKELAPTLLSQLGQAGVQPEDGLGFVIDVVAAGKKVDKKGMAEGKQAPADEGMPEVKADGKKAAIIEIPKGVEAPKKLQEQVLIKGKGPEVKAGQGLIAQYTGVQWSDGKKFDSSWDHGGATAFQIGNGSVVKGWDKGLVGKHVGDRVLLVIPPEQAYGATPPQGSPIKKNATLAFVVDILGAV